MNAVNTTDPLLLNLIEHARPVKGMAADRQFISSAEFAATPIAQDWLIENCMVRNEPVVIGGPQKTLKTSVVLDLAISLAAGFNTRFLGKFEVSRSHRVGVISGESGKATLQRKAKAICNSKCLSLEDLSIQWRFRMPQLSVQTDLDALAEDVKQHRLDVLILDPMYLGLLTEKNANHAGNVFLMGVLLQRIVQTCLPYGCTPVLVHHTRKLRAKESMRPLELDDLSQAGFGEFARQWLLLSRRSRYVDGSGQHELWLRTGGSAGHGGLWGLDVKEGKTLAGLTGSQWKVSVLNSQQLKTQKLTAQSDAKQARNQKLVSRIVEYLHENEDGDTKSGIKTKLSLNSQDCSNGLNLALEQGLIVAIDVAKNGKTYPGFRVNPSIS